MMMLDSIAFVSASQRRAAAGKARRATYGRWDE